MPFQLELLPSMDYAFNIGSSQKKRYNRKGNQIKFSLMAHSNHKTINLINAIKFIQAAYSKIPSNLDDLDSEPNENWRDALINADVSIVAALTQLESYCETNNIETNLFDLD